MVRRKPTRAEALGLYQACLNEVDRAALAAAADGGLEEESAILRLLIKRELDAGRPAAQVADLIDCLARVLRTQHSLAGRNVKQLDEALAAGLEAIARELGLGG